jgi:hypothetical protein
MGTAEDGPTSARRPGSASTAASNVQRPFVDSQSEAEVGAIAIVGVVLSTTFRE